MILLLLICDCIGLVELVMSNVMLCVLLVSSVVSLLG